MKKILFLGTFSETAKTLFQENLPEGFESLGFHSVETAPFSQADYIICRSQRIDAALLEKMPKVRLIQKWGAGYDKIDVVSAAQKGIPVAVCLGTNSIPVSEMALALMLASYRNLIAMQEDLCAGTVDRDRYIADSFTISGKTVGILGMGNIGQRVARLARAFDAKVMYYDPYRLNSEQDQAEGFVKASLDEIYASADIISLHLPLTEMTEGMIDRACFQKMKKTALLINTARGAIVNEPDLIWALENHEIGGAGLDTVCSEPLEKDSPLLHMKHVTVTAHCGGNTADNTIVMVKHCYHNILSYISGDPNVEREIVNRQLLSAARE